MNNPDEPPPVPVTLESAMVIEVMLIRERAKVAELTAALDEANKIKQEVTKQCAFDVASLLADLRLQRVAAHENASDAARHFARLHQLARDLPPFLEMFVNSYKHFADEALTIEAREMRRSAREYLALLREFL